MTQSLKKKFIVTAMTAISILLIVILGVINMANAIYNSHETKLLLDALYENTVNNDMQGFYPGPNGMMQDIPPENGIYPGRKNRDRIFDLHVNEHSKMSAVYFLVRFDANGEPTSAFTDRATVTQKEAMDLAREVLEKNRSTGRTGQFKYRKAVTRNGENVLIFLDVVTAKNSVLQVLLFSLLALGLFWILMLLLVIRLSEKAIRPFAENMERQKQFVTDAGHEIKTPLAIILANTEALELHNGESKWSKNIREQVNRLSGLTQNLLTLARIDEGTEPPSIEEFSLSELVNGTFDMFIEPAALKGVMIDVETDGDVKINANMDMISRLVSVLADNAMKYSVSESEITVKVGMHEKQAELKITNTCEKLPEVAPDKLFDRFYRADGARTQKKGGYGIGLSAAEAIVRLHKGSIAASYGENNTITFTVRI